MFMYIYALTKDVPMFRLDKQHGNLECQKMFYLIKTFLLFDDSPVNLGCTITILMYSKKIITTFLNFSS